MARHAAAGDHVQVLFLADGVSARDDSDAKKLERQAAARRACAILGTKAPRFVGLADNRLDSMPLLDVVRHVEAVVEEVRPEVVYTHHGGDLNVDHRVSHQAVVTACRPQPGQLVRRICAFEVPSSTEWQTPGEERAFAPNWFVDIDRYMGAKRQALVAYTSEMRRWPHARSMQAVVSLAQWRGASVGMQAAEAFSLVRMLD
jgi:LmbE family N-acetylglucosaminyl deacetylase